MWTCFLDATQTPLRSNQLTQTCNSFPSSQPFSEEKFVGWTTRLAQECIYAVTDWVYFHMWKQLYAILWASNDWLYMKLFLHVKVKRTDFDKQALRNRILVIRVIKERNVSLARIHPLQSPTFHHKCLNRPDSKSLEITYSVLSTLIRETPDSGPYLPVSRLESDISQIISKIAISCTLDFPTINFQIFCVVWATAGTLTFPDKFWCATVI